MEFSTNMLVALKYIGGTLLTLGMTFFLIGIIGSDYRTFIPIGIGTIVGTVFIFLIGVFLVASEEIVAKKYD